MGCMESKDGGGGGGGGSTGGGGGGMNLGPPPPRQLTPEEQAAKAKEAAEDKMWQEEAKKFLGGAPPDPVLPDGATEEQYKEYMQRRYEKESWDNKPILLGRKMRKEHQEAGGVMLMDGGTFEPSPTSCVHNP